MNTKILFSAITLVSAALLSSCTYKNYQRPADIEQDALYGTFIQETDTNTLATMSWRELYTDPYLQTLIEKALERNADLRIQEWAVNQAKASRTAGRLAYVPSLGITASRGYTYYGKEHTGDWSYSIPIALNWEFDALGGLTNQKRMSEAAYLMQQDAMQAVQSRLVANIASLYYQLLLVDEQKKVADEALKVFADMVVASEEMMKQGLSDGIAVAQFKGQQYEVQASVQELYQQETNLEIEICALLDEKPHHIERGEIFGMQIPELATGLSSQLLINRPDVRQAERNLKYFYHGKQYAITNFLPKFNIDAEAIFSGQWITRIFGSIAQPLFNQYKTVAAYKAAKAQYEQAKIEYQKVILEAGNDVVLALTNCNTAKTKIEYRTKQVEEYAKAVSFSRTQMFNGECTYLDVLTAENNLFSKQISLVEDKFSQLESVIKLYLALGGGGK